MISTGSEIGTIGHPYRARPDQRFLIAPLIMLIRVAVIDLFVVLPPTVPWFCDRGHSFRILLAPLLVTALVLLMTVQALLLVVVQALVWRFVKAIWYRERAEADAAFANLDSSRLEEDVSEPAGEPAAVFVEWFPDRRGHLAWFDVYVDDRPVWTVTGERLTPVIVSEGQHRIFIKVGHMKSDEVEVDLAAGGFHHLVCGMKPLIQNRFFRFFEMKLRFVAIPVAVVCFFVPAAMRILEERFAVEFFAILIIGFLGIYASMPRYFSRRPGAMVYLGERPDPPGAD